MAATKSYTEADVTSLCVELGWDPNNKLDRIHAEYWLDDDAEEDK